MAIDIMGWASDRASCIAGLTAMGLLVLDPETGQPAPIYGLSIDEIGRIVTGGAWDDEGNETEAPTVIEGHHVNLRAYGPLAEALTEGIEQDGGLFERTRILAIVPGLVWEPVGGDGVPAGYEGPHGLRLYDPAQVTTPMRIWG